MAYKNPYLPENWGKKWPTKPDPYNPYDRRNP